MSEPQKEPNPHVSLTVRGGRAGVKLTRRETMQWVMGAIAASSLPAIPGCGAEQGHKKPAASKDIGAAPQEVAAAQPAAANEAGYGYDANLTRVHKPGDLWPLTFSEPQKKTATALADTIFPKDHLGPAASELGVIDMMDEWISAPYAAQQSDRPVILDGLKWLEAESDQRFKKSFAELSDKQKHAICDDICYAAKAKKQFKTAARFFTRFRSIAAGAYYATPEGWQAIGYVGNVALASFDGPPPEVLEKLGVTQTVS